MEMEIRVNGKLWIEMNLKEKLGKNTLSLLEEVFSKVITDKNRVEIIGASRDPDAPR